MHGDAILGPLEEFFRARADGVACVYVFGSVARGESRSGSDVDVAVLFTKDPPRTLEGSGVRLGGELERSLGRRVDLVALNRAPVDRAHRVLVDGILVVELDRSARVEFEVRIRRVLFALLGKAGWLPAELSTRLQDMAVFRNVKARFRRV